MLADPVPTSWKFCCYCVPLALTAFSPCSSVPFLLCCVYLPFIKVSRLRIYTSLVHVKLIYLNGIPIVKVSSRITQRVLNWTICSYSVNIVWSNSRTRFEIRFRSLSLKWRHIERNLILILRRTKIVSLIPKVWRSFSFFS